MSFTEKYELLDLIAENETRTYLARERATVRMVMVHQLLAGPNRIGLLEMVLRARMVPALAGRVQILDLGEHEGTPFVVTEIIPGFRTLREWLQAELAYGARAQEGKQGAASKAPPTSPAVSEAVRPSAPQTVPAGSFPAPPAPVGREPAREPGEFTQLFRVVMHEIRPSGGPAPQRPEPPALGTPAETAARPEAVPGPQQASPPQPPPAQPAHEPGEFTRMFQSGWTAPAPPSHSAPASQAQEPARQPGEFTRMFQQGLPASPPPAPAVPGPSPVPPPLPASGPEPGEFTRMFQSPLAPAPLEPPAAPVRPLGSGGMPAPASPGPGPAWGPPSAGLSGGPQPSPGAGEFTRIFGSPGSREQTAPPPSFAGPTAGGATQLFASPAAPPPAPAPGVGGPGEFTRIVSAPPPEAAAPAASAQAAARAPVRRSSSPYLPLYLILGAVLLLAVLLVLYFALRH